MKKMLTLVCFTLCFYLNSQGQDQQYESTIDILPTGEKKDIKNEHDLIVTHHDNRYVIEFNLKHGKKIQTHQASVVTEKYFDKASFKWLSDNKVAIKLSNMNSRDVFELKVLGEKSGTGMEIEINDTVKL
jgi:hypothetical protein